MAEKKPPRAIASARKSTDKRKVGTAKNPTVVGSTDASKYKMIKPAQVTKKAAGRPKKPQ